MVTPPIQTGTVRRMNGPHDVGGRHGFGPVRREASEPVFHEPWEGLMLGIATALELSPQAAYSSDEFRYAIERMGWRAYLESSYYVKWLCSIERLLAERDLVRPEETAARAKAGPPPRPAATGARGELTQLLVDGLIGRLPAPGYEAPAPPSFAPGDAVRARNLQTVQHLRLPGYAKGRRGTIEAHRGAFPHPEWRARFGEERPTHQYAVRFEAGELWGDAAERPGDLVHLDLFEDYLEAA
jgi:nitrile hydratase